MKKIILGFLSFVLIIGVIRWVFELNHMDQLGKSFESIKAGDPEERVIQLMNKPAKVVKIGENGSYLAKNGKCAEEYQYFSSWPLVNSEILVIGFDTKGKVVTTYPFRSP